MSESVPQIQQGALTAFTFIRRNHVGLVLATARDGILQRGSIARQQLVHVALQPFEKGQVADQAVLDNLGQSRRQLVVRQSVQRVGIRQHHFWLIERAYHVFAQRMVDAGLAAHRRIYLRQQRGRYLDERHTAQISRSGITRHIANHAAAQRNQRCAALAAILEQRVIDRIQRAGIFIRFTVRHDDGHAADADGPQGMLKLLKVQRGNRGIGNNGYPLARHMRLQQFCLIEQAAADVYRITAFAQSYGQCLHNLPVNSVSVRCLPKWGGIGLNVGRA